jgi:hypothetical protein
VIWVSDFALKLVTSMPLNFTEVACVKKVPVIVTEVAMGPLVGVKLVMVGGGCNA